MIRGVGARLKVSIVAVRLWSVGVSSGTAAQMGGLLSKCLQDVARRNATRELFMAYLGLTLVRTRMRRGSSCRD